MMHQHKRICSHQALELQQNPSPEPKTYISVMLFGERTPISWAQELHS